MRVIALAQCYNEELFIRRNLNNVKDLVDRVVVTEGVLSPHGDLRRASEDGTYDEIVRFVEQEDSKCDVLFLESWGSLESSREAWEGRNKNMMLRESGVEDGDVIYILDADEFIPPNVLEDVVDRFKRDDSLNCVRMREKQFAYGFSWYFPSSHPRFFRYREGSRFGTTNHFKHPNGVDLSRRPDLDVDGMFHFCWSKHPLRVREKVLSFNRPSFTAWFNQVYLVWPSDPERAYANNKLIPPYHGTGFTEGMHEPLRMNNDPLPREVSDLIDVDWTEYVTENAGKLRI